MLRALLAIALVLLTACGPDLASPSTPAEDRAPAAIPSAAPTRKVIAETVDAVTPSLKATIAGGIHPDLPRYIRTLPGVAAAARVLLSKMTITADGVPGEVTVAGVDPEQFRPLAPEATAQARFVWSALSRSEIFLSHEDYRRLGADPGTNVRAEGPGSRTLLRVGGVAANGIPNLAGAMISIAKAKQLGLGEPTLLLIGLTPGAKHADVEVELGRLLVGVQFQRIGPPTGRAYLTGTLAANAIGSFLFTPNPDGTITQNAEWVSKNIVSAKMPIFTGSMKCHRVMFPQLRGALTELQDAGLAHLIDPKQFGGCYVPRFIGRDQNRPISMHAWGLAIDFNTIDNPQGAVPKMDLRVVDIFERWGFRWGGRWSVPDGHHFEIAALIKR